MKFTIRYKGGAGSGNFGHAGRPGHLGGSASGGGMGGVDRLGIAESPYTGSFSEASDSLIKDAKAGTMRGNWTLTSSGSAGKSAKMELPDGGKAVISTRSEHFVTGKYVAGTTSQQRYKVTVSVITYKKDQKNNTGYSRWDSYDLWTKKVKPDGLRAAQERALKVFDKFVPNE